MVASAQAAVTFGDPDPTFETPAPPQGTACMNAIASMGDATMFVAVSLPEGSGASRLLKNGAIDASWGVGGRVALPKPAGAIVSVYPSGFLPLPDGGVIVVGQNLVRITRDGAIDTSYGNQGVSDELRDGGEGSGFIESFAVQPDGSVVTLTRGYNGGPLAAFTRITAHGKRDYGFGTGGVVSIPFDTTNVDIYGWAVQSDGSVEYAIRLPYPVGEIQPRLRRIPASLDWSPGTRLVPDAAVAGWLSPNVQVQPNGAVALAAASCQGAQCGESAVAVARFNGNGQRDLTFGIAGRVMLSPYASPYFPYATTVFPHLLSLNPGGQLTLIANGEQVIHAFISPIYEESGHRAYRLNADGTLDASFDNGRKLTSGTFAKYLQIDDGRIVATGQGSCLQRLTADVVRMNVPLAEYYQPQLDHYFITAEGMESGILDADTSTARWQRTGRTFGAWLPFDLPGTKRVCRFHGDVAAGPNSHFDTLEGGECDGLKALDSATPQGQAAWRFEEYAFSAVEPVNDTCPTNLFPVYRAYNGGFEHGLAPNHRYTSDASVYQAMIAKGWAAEGVRFCVPPVSSNVGTYGY